MKILEHQIVQFWSSSSWKSAASESARLNSAKSNWWCIINAEWIIIATKHYCFYYNVLLHVSQLHSNFKNGPSKICGRQSLKNFTWSALVETFYYLVKTKYDIWKIHQEYCVLFVALFIASRVCIFYWKFSCIFQKDFSACKWNWNCFHLKSSLLCKY